MTNICALTATVNVLIVGLDDHMAVDLETGVMFALIMESDKFVGGISWRNILSKKVSNIIIVVSVQ